MGHLVWFDILATVSTGTGPFLGIGHSYLLDLNPILMREICGCGNWVLKALCEIVALSNWKTQAESNGKLSIIELATRGADILQSR